VPWGLALSAGWGGGIAAIIQAYCLASAFEAALALHPGSQPWMPFLVGYLLSGITRAICSWGEDVYCRLASGKVIISLRKQLLEAFSSGYLFFAEQHQSGDIIHTVLSGVDSMDAFVGRYLPQRFITIIVPLTILTVVFSQDLISGSIFLLTAPLIPFFQYLIGRTAEQASRRQWHTLVVLNARFFDMLQGMATLKAFRGSREGEDIIHQVSDQYRQATMGTMRIAFLSSLATELAAAMSTAVIAVSIGLRLLYGKMDLGYALFVLVLTSVFFYPLRQFGACYHASLTGRKALERIGEFLLLSNKKSYPSYLESSLPSETDICFQNVDFSYSSAMPILQDACFTLKAGKMYVLCGSSGSGKTTILHLLLGLVPPAKGAITVGGIPLANLSREEWFGYITFLPQRPYLFYGSVMDNLLLAKPNATKEEVKQATERAGADEFIRELPDGYQTLLGERGFRLSGGEAQRIALARVFLRNSALMILDEPSTGLDPELEWYLEQSIHAMRQGRTIIWITHHLDVLGIADEVLLLSEGKIVAQGAHSFLMKTNAEYRRFLAENWSSQA